MTADISHLAPGHRFTLGPALTAEQEAFLDRHGYLVFAQAITADEVRMVLEEIDAIQARWVAEGRQEVNGVPIYWGNDWDGKPYVQRFTFASMHSERIRSLVLDSRFEPIRQLIGGDARVGHDEKDGVVINRYLRVPGVGRPRLGWHTDGLRDLFYLRLPQRMLNVGLHFDRIRAEDGGLRLIPGSHTQGFLAMCLRKPYFVSHRPDPKELVVETEPGDLTVHDGRLWHRVAESTKEGRASLRHSLYVPYQTGPYEPKTAASRTPLYHHLGTWGRRPPRPAQTVEREP